MDFDKFMEQTTTTIKNYISQNRNSLVSSSSQMDVSIKYAHVECAENILKFINTLADHHKDSKSANLAENMEQEIINAAGSEVH